ncbi:hypothetical protein HAX54_052970 [Datura stramonium]|uniref:Uncharacterized protein n=1 Tax=Datura stramonium TaxID=4076 RepID=A0ABS8WRQ6_DATST|nr:hypothetical protein [Datura stramonium]
MDEETFGCEMEEEILEETFARLFLSGEEWEEVNAIQGKKGIGHDRSFSGRMLMQKRRVPPSRRIVNPYDAGQSPALNQETYTGNAIGGSPILIGDLQYARPSRDSPVGSLMIVASTRFTGSY